MTHLPGQIAEFIPKWTQLNGEVAYFRYINYPGSPCEKFLHWNKMQGPPETDLCDELVSLADDVHDKTYYTAITDAIRRKIEESNYAFVACCGIDTAACIQKTALDLFDIAIRPLVLTDLCASGAGEEAHEAGLVSLRRAVGEDQVVSSSQALELLRIN